MDGELGVGPLRGEARLISDDVIDGLKSVTEHSCMLAISSPPYNIRKLYERSDKRSYEEYVDWQREVIAAMAPKVKETGSVCWQVGTYVSDGELFPLDIPFIGIFRDLGFKLRNRIIWRYNFGLNADRRLSGRYETVLWFSKSDEYYFNLDPIRIPQLYPGKRHGKKKGDKSGKPSGNPLGKNPSDYWEFSAPKEFIDDPVWDVPNVKSNHPERTEHPCQFPIELVERCVLAFTQPGDTVLDPFVGTGATAIAAVKHGRDAIGIDRDEGYVRVALQRLTDLEADSLPMRPLGLPVRRPRASERVARVPEEWLTKTHQPIALGGPDGEAVQD